MQDTTVRAARDLYLERNGFDMKGYEEPTFTLPILGRDVAFPNPPARRRAIARHDLHHALTGYGTDYAGEAEIGIWELRAGCNTAFLWLINLIAVAIGVAIAPRRVWRAWGSAASSRSLYLDARPYDELLEMDLSALRADCGLAPRGCLAPASELAAAHATSPS
jgi:hypothetical protein